MSLFEKCTTQIDFMTLCTSRARVKSLESSRPEQKEEVANRAWTLIFFTLEYVSLASCWRRKWTRNVKSARIVNEQQIYSETIATLLNIRFSDLLKRPQLHELVKYNFLWVSNSPTRYKLKLTTSHESIYRNWRSLYENALTLFVECCHEWKCSIEMLNVISI